MPLVFCGIQIIYGLKSKPFEYISAVVVHFLLKGIYIVLVYIIQVLLGVTCKCLITEMCNLLCVVVIYS